MKAIKANTKIIAEGIIFDSGSAENKSRLTREKAKIKANNKVWKRRDKNL